MKFTEKAKFLVEGQDSLNFSLRWETGSRP